MSKILGYLFTFLFINHLYAKEPASDWQPKAVIPPQHEIMLYEFHPSLYLLGYLNLYNGSICDSSPDILMEGAANLPFIRTLSESGIDWGGDLGLQADSNYPRYIKVLPNIKIESTYDFNLGQCVDKPRFRGYNYYAQQFGGGYASFEEFAYIKKNMTKLKPSAKFLQKGWVNTSGGEISGRSNIKNQVLEIPYHWKHDWAIFSGDGSKRAYYYDKKAAIVKLKKEWKPNGLILEYQDNEIISKNAKEKKLRSLKKTGSLSKGGRLKVTGSNGRSVTYCYSDKVTYEVPNPHYDPEAYYPGNPSTGEQTFRVARIEPSDFPPTDYGYLKKSNLLGSISYPNNRFIHFSYDKHWQVNRIDLPNNLGKPEAAYHIHYKYSGDNRIYTMVLDKYNLEKKYTFELNRLHTIQYHLSRNPNGPLNSPRDFYRQEVLLWNNESNSPFCGHLLGKTLQDSSGLVWGAWQYVYDDRGNVTEEKVSGQLSGKSVAPLKHGKINQKANGNQVFSFVNAETFSKFATYSKDGFNLKLSEQETSGPLITYTYYPGTNLLKSKISKIDNDLQIREFFIYNDDTALIQHIIDDGIGLYEADLSGVTQRRIKKIEVEENPDLPGFGQAKKVREGYLELSSGQFVLLKEERFTFSREDRLIKKEVWDAKGTQSHSHSYVYGAMGNLIRETDPHGYVTLYEYDSNKNCTRKETLNSGFYTLYTYDNANRLIAQEEVHKDSVKKERFSYDLLGRKLTQTDSFGETTHYTYDNLGREIKVEYPPQLLASGQIKNPCKQKSYDIADRVTSETDAEGATTKKTYNFYGQPVDIIDSTGAKEHFEYYLNGTLAKHVRKNGSYVLYFYDTLKRPIRSETYDAKGQFLLSESQKYNAFHLLSKTDSQGTVTLYRYDGAGRLIEEVSGNRRKEFAYDSLGRLNQTKTWHSAQSNDFTLKEDKFDVADRVIISLFINGAGEWKEYTVYNYDFQGRLTQTHSYIDKTKPSITSYSYNSRGELICETDALDHCTRFEYDYAYTNAINQKVLKKTRIDPLGNRQIEIYDAQHHIASIEKQDTFGKTIAYQEIWNDLKGQEVLTKHKILAAGQAIGYYSIEKRFDSLGRLTSLIKQPQTGSSKETRRFYHVSGELAAIVKPNGIRLDYTYDPLGYLKELRASDNSIDYGYTYDVRGNLLSSEDRINQITEKRIFDPWNQLLFEDLGNGLSIEYSYDWSGRLIKIQLPDQTGVTYDYDGPDLKAVSRIDSHGKRLFSHIYSGFNLCGSAKEHILPLNGGTVSFDYDLLNRIRSIKSNHWSLKIADGYDDAGNLKEYSTEDLLGKASYSFNYDALHQLIEEKGPFSHLYAYDSLFNRRQKNGSDYQLNDLNQVISDQSSIFNYDANGNLLRRKGKEGDEQFSYDALNRLQSVLKPDLKVNYTYDSFGRRIKKTFFSWNSKKKDWEKEKEDTFLYQGEKEIGRYQKGQAKELRFFGKGAGADFGAAVFIELEGAVFSPIHDQRGNIAALIDTKKGSCAQFYRTSAFGERAAFQANGAPLNHELSPWGYASKRLDLETGLIYFNKRYYDRILGRWLTADPLDYADGPNLYAYVHNNPLILFDPYGLSAWGFVSGLSIGIANGAFYAAISPFAITAQLAQVAYQALLHPIETYENSKEWATETYNTLSGLDAKTAREGIEQLASNKWAEIKEKDSYELGQIAGEVIGSCGYSFFKTQALLKIASSGSDIGKTLCKAKNISSAAKGGGKKGTDFVWAEVKHGKTTQSGWSHVGATKDRIKSGGKHPHRNDGSIFENDKTRLPNKPIGYYKEYVHPTEGAKGAGPQRIVTGQGGEMYYTPDHYETFIRVD